MTPALEPDELLVAVRLPLWPVRHGHGFLEFARRHGDFAMASAAVLLTAGADGTIDRAAIALGGVASTPVRLREAEKLLAGEPLSSGSFEAAASACKALEPLDDIHAPASYRRHLAETLTRRALAAAAERLQQIGAA
jgi:carbon-monoxide dehydrogenase medium subunit